MTMSATQGFTSVIQIAEPAVQVLARAMHAAGTVYNSASWSNGSISMDLIMDPPHPTLDPTAPPGELRMTGTQRLLCDERPMGSGPGTSNVCVVTAQLRFRGRVLASADPMPITGSSVLECDTKSTTPGDITVHLSDPASASHVASTITAWIHEQQAGQIPLSFVGSAGFDSVGLRVLPGAGLAPPVLAVGLNRAGYAGTSGGLTTNFCQNDWAVAVDTQWVKKQVVDAVAAQYGSVPPPTGAQPVLVATDSTSQTWLDALDIVFGSGLVTVSGALRRETGGSFGTTTASWSADIIVQPGALGEITATINDVRVSLAQWFAIVANVLSGGGIVDAVANAVRNTLGSALAGAKLTDVLGKMTKIFSSVGSVRAVSMEPVATSVEVRADAVIVHGTLGVWFKPEAPRLALGVSLGSSPDDIDLTVAGSWAPGDSLVSLVWSFGDGTTVSTSGLQARMAASHTYVQGSFLVSVTGTDSAGRAGTVTRGVSPGQLYCEMEGGGVNQICVTATTAVSVSSSGCAVVGATVRAEGVGWVITSRTDDFGRAILPVTRSQVEQAGLPASKPSPFHIGRFRVIAERLGFASATIDVWMVDCEAEAEVARRSRERVQQVLDRLAGYAALQQLIRDRQLEGILKDLLPPLTSEGPKPPPVPFGPVGTTTDPRIEQLVQTILTYGDLERLQLNAELLRTDRESVRLPTEGEIQSIQRDLLRKIDHLSNELSRGVPPQYWGAPSRWPP